MTTSPRTRLCTLAPTLAITLCSFAYAKQQDPKTPSAQQLTDNMITQFDPCAGSPNEAVCRCALEFPPVTYDTSVPLTLLAGDDSPTFLPTGRTLMNLVRGMVVSIAPSADEASTTRLYVNPPATPDPGPALERLVHTNPHFRELELIETLMLPRHLGGEADRLFGSIWWHPPTKTLVIAFRGTQTPFEFHLDTLVGSQRSIPTGVGNDYKVSEGFGIGYLMMRESILQTVRKYQSRADFVLVAGHSLGGAIAAITTLDITCHAECNGVFGMTFGQPRVFDPFSSGLVEGASAMGLMVSLVRVVCESDPVPAVPPAAVTGDGVKFKHTPTSVIYFDDPSADEGKGAEWNHHFYYDGYFDDARTAQFALHKPLYRKQAD